MRPGCVVREAAAAGARKRTPRLAVLEAGGSDCVFGGLVIVPSPSGTRPAAAQTRFPLKRPRWLAFNRPHSGCATTSERPKLLRTPKCATHWRRVDLGFEASLLLRRFARRVWDIHLGGRGHAWWNLGENYLRYAACQLVRLKWPWMVQMTLAFSKKVSCSARTAPSKLGWRQPNPSLGPPLATVQFPRA